MEAAAADKVRVAAVVADKVKVAAEVADKAKVVAEVKAVDGVWGAVAAPLAQAVNASVPTAARLSHISKVYLVLRQTVRSAAGK